jgi:uncharacterized protein
MSIIHEHTEKGGRFYVGDPASPTASMVYRMSGSDKMIIDHTEVSEIHKGEGIGKQLVADAVSYARGHNLKIQPLCVFARSVLLKNKEYQDVLVP